MIIATEDELSEAVVERLVAATGCPYSITVKMRKNGFGYLRKNAQNLLATARQVPVFLLTDLDRYACPPALICDWVGARPIPPLFRFRICVRTVEAWLLADKEGFSEFSGVSEDRIPDAPEIFADPKKVLLDLVKKYGNRSIRRDLLPASKSSARVGLGYNQVLTAFVRGEWNLQRASCRSESLTRAIKSLEELT